MFISYLEDIKVDDNKLIKEYDKLYQKYKNK